MEKRPASAWYAESLRFTAICSEDKPELPLREWWATLAGDQPSEVLDKPKERQAIVAGSFGDGALTLQHQPLRIDLILQPVQTPPPEKPEFPNVGVFETIVVQFARSSATLMHQPGFPPIERMAFGAVLLLPVDSREEGYQQLGAYLRAVQIDAKNSSEFLYRINRRRKSRLDIPDLCINRLNQWNVVVRKFFSGQPTQLKGLREEHSCRLELDVNTVPEFPDTLPEDKLDDIWNELVDVAKEIAANGDI